MSKPSSGQHIELIDFLISEKIPYKTQVLGSKLSTMCVGGPLPVLVEFESIKELQKLLPFLQSIKMNYRVLGAGSNVIIPDRPLKEVVLTPGKNFRFFEPFGLNRFRVGAASSLMQLSRKMAEYSASGLEFAGGIPAQVGGATFMNAGAHKGEMSQLLVSVTWLNSSGEMIISPASELNFEYRHSSLPKEAIITEVVLKLAESSSDIIQKVTAEYLEERKKRQPLQYPSAGSIFKNPNPEISKGASAGALIESLNLKGYKNGGAEISTLHANWIINPQRRASAFDVSALIAYVQQTVQENFDIDLVPEVQLW